MTASEFAFLALGLVLGLASGAALLEVLRARPPSAREVRITVAPNAIHARFPSTLSDPNTAQAPAGPSSSGPGDRRWHDESPIDGADPARRRAEDRLEPVAAVAAVAAATAVGDPPGAVEPGTPVRPAPDPLWLSPLVADPRELVPVPMSIEPDPLTTALRSTAASVAAAATATMAEGAPDAADGNGAVAVATAAAVGKGDGDGDGMAEASAATNPAPTEARPDAGPCAEERRIAEERCAVAARAREGAAAAAETLRIAQRAHDDHIGQAEADAAASDPRAVRAAKEEAQQRFHAARARAGTHDDVEAAARAWLAEINGINRDTREAASRVDKSRAQAASIALTLERLAVEADAARISAEQADEACVAAREAVAACDEAQALQAAAARVDAPPAPAAAAAAAPIDRIAPVNPTAAEEEHAPGEAMGSRAGQDALILRILRGDHAAMQLAVARLAGDEADDGRRWQALLSALAEALIARSIEASSFDFPSDHFFWSLANRSENRDIMAGLSSLGYRFDGFGGWVDERIPSQRDLSLAVGYAGLDPMRVRHWPNEAEMRDLLADVRVTADEYVAGAAGSMTLGELVSLLGRRADGLTELWNDWGHVRPVLLEAA